LEYGEKSFENRLQHVKFKPGNPAATITDTQGRSHPGFSEKWFE
jgi:hypothetical protein